MDGRKRGVTCEGPDRRRVLDRMRRTAAAELRQRIRDVREAHVLRGEVRDAEKESLDAFTEGMDLVLAQCAAGTLRGVEAALRRMGQGTYGECQECGQAISPARLAALPHAETCRPCQERREEETVPGPRAATGGVLGELEIER
jgi:DnaK suppressor protein